MDNPNPLVPFSPQCLLWGMLASLVEMQLRNSSNAEQFNGLHNEARVSRGVGSRRRANAEKRVVSRKHSLLFRMMAMQLWRLAGIILVAPKTMQCILFPWAAIVELSS